MNETSRALPAGLPLATFDLDVAGRRWSIRAVRDQDALLDAAEQFAHVPYGLLLWESAVSLARALAERPTLCRGRSVLEIGCGVGLAGIVAAGLGGNVVQTDHEPAVLALAAANAEQNGITGISQRLADWRAWPLSERFDLVLGADVLYEAAMHDAVARVIDASLAPGGTVLLADPGRPNTLPFLGALERKGWRVDFAVQPAADLLVAGRTVDVTLIGLVRSSDA